MVPVMREAALGLAFLHSLGIAAQLKWGFGHVSREGTGGWVALTCSHSPNPQMTGKDGTSLSRTHPRVANESLLRCNR